MISMENQWPTSCLLHKTTIFRILTTGTSRRKASILRGHLDGRDAERFPEFKITGNYLRRTCDRNRAHGHQAALKKLLPYCPVPTILTSVTCRNTIIKLNARSFKSLHPFPILSILKPNSGWDDGGKTWCGGLLEWNNIFRCASTS